MAFDQWKRMSEEDSNTGEQNKAWILQNCSSGFAWICYLDLFLPFAILLEVKAATLTLIKTDSPAYMINSDNHHSGGQTC